MTSQVIPIMREIFVLYGGIFLPGNSQVAIAPWNGQCNSCLKSRHAFTLLQHLFALMCTDMISVENKTLNNFVNNK